MARGPIPSGRAPAHLTVLPGGAASGGLDDLEDDRTTIEPEPTRGVPPEEQPTPIAGSSGLEEQWEDGTTVSEQSSSKRSAVVEEPTIEDQARPLPPLQLVPPPAAPDPASSAKLVVIAGSDQGRVFDLRGGSDVRIGRAVDNDVVLTDIAVSRKHLVLSWDGSAWVVQDNGSGNGTLINDRLEDGRCQLHHGDRIEIGNTVFRIDHPPSAHAQSVAGWGQQEEDAATVAGKAPTRPSQIAAAVAEPPARGRPQSITAPVRDRAPSPRQRKDPTMPPPPPRGRPPSVAPPPQAPRATSTMSPPPVAAPAVVPPPRLLSTPGERPSNSAIPLERPSSGSISQPLSGPFTAPSPMPAVSSPYSMPYGANLRPMTTTQQVEPRPFPSTHPSWAAPPQHSRRRGIIIGAGIVAMASLIAAAAMVSSSDKAGGGGTATVAGSGSVTGSGSGSASGSDSGSGSVSDSGSGSGSVSGTGTGSGSVTGTATGSGSGSATGSGSASDTALVATPGSGSAAVEPPPPTPAPPAPPPPAPVEVRPADPDPDPDPAPAPPSGKPAPAVRKPDRQPATRPTRVATSPSRKLDLDADPEPKPAGNSKALAAAEKKAEGLYKAKDFKGAAAALREAIGASTEPEVKPLKARANDYDTIGANLTAAATVGAQRPTDALAALVKAQTADRRVGAAHQSTIRAKIGEIAPKAAASWMAKQNYEAARQAADQAVNVGAGGSPIVEGVRNSLERKAGEFYATAAKLQKSKPEEAKALARRITKMVPPGSPWYPKAVKIIDAKTGRDDDE